MFTGEAYLSARYVALSQVCLVLPLVLCTILRPHFWQGSVTGYATGGISVPSLYAMAFGGCVLFLVLAGRKLRRARPFMKTRVALYALAVFYLVDWGTAYCWQLSNNPTVDATHLVADACLFFGQLIIAGVAVARSEKWLDLALLTGQLCGVVVLVLVYFDLLHVLFAAEVITGVTFAAILIRHMRRLTTAK